jgi:hypothetical protein
MRYTLRKEEISCRWQTPPLWQTWWGEDEGLLEVLRLATM